jgi:hypothetical protein
VARPADRLAPLLLRRQPQWLDRVDPERLDDGAERHRATAYPRTASVGPFGVEFDAEPVRERSIQEQCAP